MKQYRSWLLIAGLAGLSGTHCAAEQSDDSSSTATADAVAEYEQALAKAPVSLAQAITNAKAKYPNGTLQDAKFVADGVSPVFEVDLNVGTSVLEGRIDPASGEVQSWGPDDDAEDEAAEGEEGEAPEGRVPCDHAIGAAEAAGNGRAVEIADDGSWFGVRVYRGGEFHDVDVDGQGNVGGIRRVEWGNRGRGPRPGHGSGNGAAGADGMGPGGPWQGQAGDSAIPSGPWQGQAGDNGGPSGPWQGQGGGGGGPSGPWQGQGGDGAGPRGGAHQFPGSDAGSKG